MKKCDHFKDLILTDYIDGQLDKNSAEVIESHLLDCSDCRAFFKEIKTNAILPFQQTTPQAVPAELWENIKQGIETTPPSPWKEFIQNLKGFLVFPRLVPVLASLVLMLIVGSVSLNTIQVQQAKATDQGQYLVSVLSSAGSLSSADNNDLGTPIEHYFL